MRILVTCIVTLVLTMSTALAGPYQGGYGGGQWGGKDGTGIEAGKGGNTRGSGQCNKCSTLDNPVGRSVTRNSGGWEGNLGMTGPIPHGSVTYKGPSKSTTTTYARPDRGIDGDGGSCTCSHRSDHR